MRCCIKSTINQIMVLGMIIIICGYVFASKTIRAEDLSLSPSEKMFNNFQSIAAEAALEILKDYKATPEQAKHMKGTLQETANAFASKLMEVYKNSFVVSDVEAKKILSGQYDVKNKENIKNYIFQLKISDASPSSLFTNYFIKKYQEDSLSSSELEFTARYLKDLLEKSTTIPRQL